MKWLRLFDFDDLLILHALGSGLSVSETARRLGVSQPAVSHRLRKMESILKASVVVRSKSQAHLTGLGAELAGMATETLMVIDRTFGARLGQSIPDASSENELDPRWDDSPIEPSLDEG